MRKKYFILTLFVLLTNWGFSQNVYLKNKGIFIKVNQSTNVKVNGTIINENNNNTAGRIYNDGNIFVSSNIVNSSTDSVFDVSNTSGNVILDGNGVQHFQGNTVAVENLYLANSGSDTALSLLDNNHIVTNKLTFSNNNKVATNNNYLVITNTALNSIEGYNNNNFVYGNLRRYIDGNQTDFYFFPVGKSLASTDYHLAALKPNTLTGTNYVDVNFDDLTNSNDADLVATELGTQYYEMAHEGVWHINPDAEPTNGSYDLRLYIDNIAGLSDNKFAILSRPEGSTTAADWTCAPCGIGNPGLSPNNGDGRLVADGYALRQGYSHFSEFGIGKLGCVNVDLGPDTTLCAGSSLTLYPGNYVSYQWSTGSTDTAIVITTSGTYSVTVTDDMGCTTSDSINIIISSPISLSIVVDTPTCTSSGSIDLTVSGGISPYTYSWNTGATSEDINDAQPGTYIVTVTDSVGCTASDTIEVPNLMANITLTFSNVTDVTCYGLNNGHAEVEASGGASPYSYQWNNGSTSNIADNLAAGWYYVTATDINGCTGEDSVKINQPEQINIEISANNVSCYGSADGEVMTNVTGGTSPYAYQWNTGSTSSMITGLQPGAYSVTVMDNNGCTDSAQAIVSEPTPIRISENTTDPLCYGDSATIALQTSGGMPPYTYSWNIGASDSTIQVTAGEYTVTVTDNNGCDTTISVSVDYNGLEPLIVEDTVTQPNGYEFNIDLTVSGGTSPYTYLWNSGETNEDITVSMGGTYIVTVTDNNGCTVYDTVDIDMKLLIPTVITPNGDGQNDTWRILNIGTYDDVTIEIYNRWGDQLFEFHGNGYDYLDPKNQWDGTYNGKKVPFGEYLYIVKLGDDVYKGTLLVKY